MMCSGLMICTCSSVMMSAALTTPALCRSMRIVLGLIAGVLDDQALDVQDDVGDVLDHAGDGGDLVLHALDLDARDGTALQAGEQDAPQAVADGDAEAALERLGVELAVGVGQRFAVADTTVGQLQATPLEYA